MDRDIFIELDRGELDVLVALCVRSMEGQEPVELITAVLVKRLKAAQAEVDSRSD